MTPSFLADCSRPEAEYHDVFLEHYTQAAKDSGVSQAVPSIPMISHEDFISLTEQNKRILSYVSRNMITLTEPITASEASFALVDPVGRVIETFSKNPQTASPIQPRQVWEMDTLGPNASLLGFPAAGNDHRPPPGQ